MLAARSTATMSFLLCALGCCIGSAGAQPPAPGVAQGSSASPGSSANARGPLTGEPAKPEIFGILIPIDENNQVEGEYVYVPTRLSRMLSNPIGTLRNTPGTSLISAVYSFRMSTEPGSQSNSISEIAADFKIDVSQTDSEIAIPFGSEKVQIIRVHHDGQDVSFSPRLRQSTTQLTWRATDIGVHTLRILFRPLEIATKSNRQSIAVDIPTLATSKLEVLGDDLRDFQVDSLGSVNFDTSKFLTASLGAVNQLSCSWPQSVSRVTDITQVQVFSDTWLHFHPDSVVAMCQLRITGAGALPETLRLIGDPAWQPIGNDWHGAKLLRVDSPSVGSRPSYTITRPMDGKDTLTIRTLMLPRDESSVQSLSIPFISLQESPPLARTLAVSNVGRPRWKRVGTENWQAILTSQISDFWLGDRLAEQPTLLRVPSGPITANLQRVADPAAVDAEEVTEVILHAAKTRVRYSVHWSQPLVGTPFVRFRVPKNMKTETVQVDGVKALWTYVGSGANAGQSNRSDGTTPNVDSRAEKSPPATQSETSEHDELIVFIDAARGGVQSVDVQAEIPHGGPTVRLPRVLLENAPVSSSIYQLLRGAEVFGELKSLSSDAIHFEPMEIRPSILLLNLHTPIGQVNLGAGMRDSAELPVEVSLRPRKFTGKAVSVMRLQRSDQGWKAQLDLDLENTEGQSSDFVFLDVPSSLISSLQDSSDKNHPLMNWPSADSSRSILCIMPGPGKEPKTRISLAMRLTASGASQSITIPDINILAESGARPLIALPNEINQAPVRWTQGGRALPSDYLERQGVSDIDLSGYSLFDLGPTKTQAVWQPRRREERVARILLTQLRMSLRGGRVEPDEITYWVDPRTQMMLDVLIPDALELRVAELNGRATTWSRADNGRYRFLMQPSYLPIALKLKCHRRDTKVVQDPTAEDAFPLPQVSAQPLGEMLVELRGPIGSLNDLLLDSSGSSRSQELDAQSFQAAKSAAWADLLRQSLPTAADRSQDELQAWLPIWSPQHCELGSMTPVPAALRSGLASDDSTVNTEQELSTAEYWSSFTAKLGVEPQERVVPSKTAPIETGTRRFLQFSAGGTADDGKSQAPAVITVRRRSVPEQALWLWILAPLTAILVAARFLSAGPVSRRLTDFGENLWPAWLGLLALVALVSPVQWPIWLIGLGTGIVIVRLLLGARHESRSNGYPYRVP